MTTTPAKKHSVRRDPGHFASRSQRKTLRRRGIRAFRFWQHLTRCYATFRQRISTSANSWFRRLRAALGASALCLGLPTLVQAANFQVTSDSDISNPNDGVTTLREAIVLANGSPGPDTVNFSGVLSGATIVLTQGALVIGDDLSIDASSLAQAPMIDANQNSRVVNFTGVVGDLAIAKLILRNGKSSTGGGGIRFSSTGNLSLTDSALVGNSSTGFSGVGGGIYAAYGNVELTNTTVTGNSSRRRGGGIYAYFGHVSLTDSELSGNSTTDTYGSGAGIFSYYGNVTLSSTTLSANSIEGYAGSGGGIYSNLGDVTLTDSTVSENKASREGGGIFSKSGLVSLSSSSVSGNYADGRGGGIGSGDGSVTITNSTISGNSADGRGGGIGSDDGSVTITNSTISGNSAYYGGGISAYYGAVSLTNTIIAGNLTEYSAPDVSAPEDPANDLEVSYCLIGNSSGAGLEEAKINQNNITDVDPLLAPLADNGGPTQTHALRIGSPATDKGNATGPDQRGFARVDNPYVPNASGGNGSDIGAFEGPIAVVVSNVGDVNDGDYSEGNLTLREAISLANGDPELNDIGFLPSLSGQVISLTQGELVISTSLHIDASSPAEVPIIDASNGSRVMHFTGATGNLLITNLTLRNGNTTGNGGGILFASSGVLTLTDCSILGNTASGEFGGGIYSGSGIISLANSTVNGNSTLGSGGGIHAGTGDIILAGSSIIGNSTTGALGGGGGISSGTGGVFLTDSTVNENSTAGATGGGISSSSGVITLTNSSLGGNSATTDTSKGGGIFAGTGSVELNLSVLDDNTAGSGGGVASNDAAVSLVNSTLSGNSAIGNSGFGGGIASESGNVSVANSTLSGNFTTGNSGDGGGIHSNTGSIALSLSTLSGNSVSGAGSDGGGIHSTAGDVMLTSSTVSGNSASGTGSTGGGIHVSSGALILTNSIIAGNSDNGTAPDVRSPNAPATKLEVSYSLIGNSTGARLGEAKINLNNLAEVDPLLEPLAANGGPTLTHALAVGSPAVDQGYAIGEDQRGLPRVDDSRVPNAAGGNGSDMGAFERPGGVTVSEIGDVTDGEYSDGNLSLREAIELTNGNPSLTEINFRNDLSGALILLTQGELDISKELSIDASSLAQAPIVDAGQNSRVMDFNGNGDLRLTKLTLRNGRTTGYYESGGGIRFNSTGSLFLSDSTLTENSVTGYESNGGGIYSSSGDITLTNSTLSGNAASGGGGDGGGIHSRTGDITLTNSTLSGNSAGDDGGGVRSYYGAVTLTNSTLSGNSADDDGGGMRSYYGAVTLTDSTLSGNSAGDDGGGIWSSYGAVTLTNSTLGGNSAGDDGGGIWSSYGAVTLSNSTLSGNSTNGYSGDGGGIFAGYGTLALVSSTVWGNSASGEYGDGGGIFSSISAVALSNSIIAGNTATNSGPDLRAPGAPGSNLAVSYCLIGNSSGARLEEAMTNLNNITNVDPLLAPLADNGGPTMTHALGVGSPAIDQGNATGPDQRGLPRVDNPNVANAAGGNGSDIGAFETQDTSDINLIFNTDDDGDGNVYGIEQALGTNPNFPDPANPLNLAPPTFNLSGQPMLGFGISSTAAPGTQWILERSTSLTAFEEIYRFDGTNHIDYIGIPINIQITPTGVVITDQAPPDGAVFYRFKTYLESP